MDRAGNGYLARGNCGPHRRRRTDQAKPGYSLAEYNQYQAADKEPNPQQKIKALDDFVKAYPNSTLMPYIYRDYYTTYMALKNFAQAIEYADRMIALGDKIDTTGTPRSVLHPRPGLLSGMLATRLCKLPTR